MTHTAHSKMWIRIILHVILNFSESFYLLHWQMNKNSEVVKNPKSFNIKCKLKTNWLIRQMLYQSWRWEKNHWNWEKYQPPDNTAEQKFRSDWVKTLHPQTCAGIEQGMCLLLAENKKNYLGRQVKDKTNLLLWVAPEKKNPPFHRQLCEAEIHLCTHLQNAS